MSRRLNVPYPPSTYGESTPLQKAQFLPARTVVRFTLRLRGYFERLVGTGQAKMQVVGACMRKLVMICSGVLKNRKPFDPAFASKIAT
jgi:transposase